MEVIQKAAGYLDFALMFHAAFDQINASAELIVGYGFTASVQLTVWKHDLFAVI